MGSCPFFWPFKGLFLVIPVPGQKGWKYLPLQSQAFLRRSFFEWKSLPFPSPHSLCIFLFFFFEAWTSPLGILTFSTVSEEMTHDSRGDQYPQRASFPALLGLRHSHRARLLKAADCAGLELEISIRFINKHLSKPLHWPRKSLTIFQISILCVWPSFTREIIPLQKSLLTLHWKGSVLGSGWYFLFLLPRSKYAAEGAKLFICRTF